MGHLGTVGTATQSTTSLSATVVTTTVPAGATILLAVVWDAPSPGGVPTIASVVDDRGNTYSSTPDVSVGAGVTLALAIVRGVVTTPLQVGDEITVTISGDARGRWAVQADAFDDLDADPLDQVASNAPGSSGSLSTGVTAATEQPTELVYCAFGFGANRTPTVPGGWTAGPKVESDAGSGDRGLQVMHRYVDVAGTQEGTLTLSSSSTYAGAVATYLAEATDPPVVDVTGLQMQMPLPPEGPPPVVDVTGLRMQMPAGQVTTGEVHVSRLRMRLPAAPGQAPYSGIKGRTSGGSLRDVAIYVAE